MTILRDAVAQLMLSFGSATPTDDARIARRLETLARDCALSQLPERKAIFRR